MTYEESLQWLQGLLSGPNWKYALSREQLATQAALQREAQAEQSRQAAAELALRKVMLDWQNQLARQQQRQAERAQAYGEQTQTYQSSPEYLNILRSLQPSPAQATLGGNFLQDFSRRINYNPLAERYNFSVRDALGQNQIGGGALNLGLGFRQPAAQPQLVLPRPQPAPNPAAPAKDWLADFLSKF